MNNEKHKELIDLVMPYMISWIEYGGSTPLDDINEQDLKYCLTSSGDPNAKLLWERIQDMSLRYYREFYRELLDACSKTSDERYGNDYEVNA